MSARVLFHVQHLLGTGHLRRTAILAGALVRHGFQVEIVSGGPPIAGLDTGGAALTQLAPLRAADATFRVLVDEAGRPADDAFKTRRREHVLSRLHAVQPHAVVTELFPLGRRALSFELIPLIEAARAMVPRPLILASVRDVVAAKGDAAKTEEMIGRVRAWYDHVLVHGDPALLPLDASFPAAAIADRLAYTGYVRAPAPAAEPSRDGQDEIVVSVGGGAVGAALLRTAVAARGMSRPLRRWRLLLGAGLPAEIRAELAAAADPLLAVEPARRDFVDLLKRCHVSVSQAGYNTVMDLLDAQARAVVIPFAGGGETEQTLRAAALARRGWAQVVTEAELTPAALAAAVARAGAGPRPDAGGLRRDGAAQTARFVRAWLSRRGCG